MNFKKFRDFFRISNFYKVISNTYEVIARFILRRTNLNKVDKNGDTVLHRALYWSDYKTASRLIKCGADVNAIDGLRLTPLLSAIEDDKPEMVALLLKHGADVNFESGGHRTPLFSAIRNDNPEIVALLLKHGADVNSVDRREMRVLHSIVYDTLIYATTSSARRYGYEVVRLLIEHGADINAVGTCWPTPLLSAIEKNNPEMVAFLLKHGADVNLESDGYSTPLLSAIRNDNPEIVALLLKHGADINFDSGGFTPLLRAIVNHNHEMVASLLEYGANVNAVSRYGFTPLLYAVLEYKCHEPMTLSIARVLIIAVLLDNINAEKPDFIDRNQPISTLWDESKVILNKKLSGTLSLWDLCKEKYEHKLALIYRNEQVKKRLENLNLKEKYPCLDEKVQTQLQKGLARNQALVTASNSIFTFNSNKELNEDCWKEILKNLPQEDLKNVTRVASLFFKQSPSNDISNFSTAIKRNLMEAQQKQDKEAQEQYKEKSDKKIEELEKDIKLIKDVLKVKQFASTTPSGSDVNMPESSNVRSNYMN